MKRPPLTREQERLKTAIVHSGYVFYHWPHPRGYYELGAHPTPPQTVRYEVRIFDAVDYNQTLTTGLRLIRDQILAAKAGAGGDDQSM